MTCLLALLLACSDKAPGPDGGTPNPDGGTTLPSDSGTTSPSDGGTPDGGTPDGGTPDGGTSDGGTSDGGTTDGGTSRAHAYDCPPPPHDAITFTAGTLHADQAFTYESEHSTMPSGWTLVLSGASYTHPDDCASLIKDQALWSPIKYGERVGDYLFQLAMTVPGTTREEFLGEHLDNGGLLASPDFSAHWLRIGWHDGKAFHWVDSMPHGWTLSKVCVGDIGVEYAYVTVLFDPIDGPYQTNLYNPLHQPIWFEAEILGTGRDPRSCFVTAWGDKVDLDEWLAEDEPAD